MNSYDIHGNPNHDGLCGCDGMDCVICAQPVCRGSYGAHLKDHAAKGQS